MSRQRTTENKTRAATLRIPPSGWLKFGFIADRKRPSSFTVYTSYLCAQNGPLIGLQVKVIGYSQ
jgi:hypothetical protein